MIYDHVRLTLVTASLLALGACRGKGESVAAASDAGPAASGAALVAPASSAAAPATPAAGGAIDLLHAGPAIVFVSSNVNNPKDYPEHLIDGREDTAWNSRTGDLVGATIAFSVPKSAHIESLVLSAGFHKTSAKGEDLFAMNQRLRQVTVRSADGTITTDWTLDPEKREPQVLPFAHPGGVYVIEVKEVVAGTQPKWRELTVSELRVLGQTTERYERTRLPEVVVGATDFERALPGTDEASYLGIWEKKLGRWSPDACKAFEGDMAPGMKSMDPAPNKPWCKLGNKLTGDAGLSVAAADLEAPTSNSMRVLQLTTAKGTTLPQNATICEQFHQGGCSDDMGTVNSTLVSAKLDGGAAVVVVKREVLVNDGPTHAAEKTELTFRCPLDAEPVVCSRSERLL